MAFLTHLWLPILLSGVFVFVVSSVIHMALPYHKGNYKKLRNEDAVLESLRQHGVEPGAYMFPSCGSMSEMKTPEMMEKTRRGPVGWMIIAPPGGWHMGKSLVWWFIYSLLIGALCAYIGWHALGPGKPYLEVFRIIGAAAVLGYSMGHFHEFIWKGERASTTAKFLIDGVIYGLVTAGTFGWLWPRAVAALPG